MRSLRNADTMTNLFQMGDFTLHSGQKATWKIECEALTDTDWETLAWMIAQNHSFNRVIGVPTGGLKLAAALQQYCTGRENTLVVDDVATTGASLWEEAEKWGPNTQVLAVFARDGCPVPSLFRVHQ